MSNKLFLYSGLSLLLAAIVIRWQGVDAVVWVPVFGVAILLKSIFLINIFRTKGFRISLWLKLIIIGVTMILISLLFKYVFPVLWLRNVLFYEAIALKVSGLVLMFAERLRKKGKA